MDDEELAGLPSLPFVVGNGRVGCFVAAPSGLAADAGVPLVLLFRRLAARLPT